VPHEQEVLWLSEPEFRRTRVELAEGFKAGLPRRTKGELSAPCGGTSMNFVAI